MTVRKCAQITPNVSTQRVGTTHFHTTKSLKTSCSMGGSLCEMYAREGV